MSGTVLSYLHMWTHLILIINLGDSYNDNLLYEDGESETKRAYKLFMITKPVCRHTKVILIITEYKRQYVSISSFYNFLSNFSLASLRKNKTPKYDLCMKLKLSIFYRKKLIIKFCNTYKGKFFMY